MIPNLLLRIGIVFSSMCGLSMGADAAHPIAFNSLGHILVKVDITIGKRTLKEKRALIDFGAGATIIDASLVEPRECHSYRALMEDATGEQEVYSKAAWLKVEVGPSCSSRVRSIVMDLHAKTSGRVEEVDLILGWEVFKGNRIVFDLQGRRMLDHPIETPDLDLPLEWSTDHLPAVSGRFNGCEVKWVLDTGSKFPVSIPKSSRPCAIALDGPISTYRGINGKPVPTSSSMQNTVTLGDQIWYYQTAWVTHDSDANLGVAFFEDCQVEFDFQNGRFRVRRSPKRDRTN